MDPEDRCDFVATLAQDACPAAPASRAGQAAAEVLQRLEVAGWQLEAGNPGADAGESCATRDEVASVEDATVTAAPELRAGAAPFFPAVSKALEPDSSNTAPSIAVHESKCIDSVARSSTSTDARSAGPLPGYWPALGASGAPPTGPRPAVPHHDTSSGKNFLDSSSPPVRAPVMTMAERVELRQFKRSRACTSPRPAKRICEPALVPSLVGVT